MECPKCQERTEVLETIQRQAESGAETRRRRRCLSPRCLFRFATVETALSNNAECSRDVNTDRLLNKLKALGRGRRGFDAEATAAAIAVDRRKRIIERERRARERYDDEHAAPRRLNNETLRRELGKY